MIEIVLCLALQEIEPSKVDTAVEEGAKYLARRLKAGTVNSKPPKQGPGGPGEEDLLKDEIVLYTLVYAGVDEKDEEFAKLLKSVLESKLESVYRVAIQALALEAIDAARYQQRIAQCGQFLVDNQCENGQWSYGKEVAVDPWAPQEAGGAGTKSRKHIVIKRRSRGPATGDNSNAQVALLGLRACMEADVVVPAETFAAAEKWWLTTQNKDGGWDYRQGRTRVEHSYGAMTAGGASSLAICKHYLKKEWKRDPAISRALAWLGANFSVTSHPKFDWKIPSHGWVHYWLYALERAGMLCEAEKLGTRDWYAEGAGKLLEAQGKDGAWDGDRDKITNTCFAILFLRRATKPLPKVATTDKGK
jgi:hypothetical protein